MPENNQEAESDATEEEKSMARVLAIPVDRVRAMRDAHLLDMALSRINLPRKVTLQNIGSASHRVYQVLVSLKTDEAFYLSEFVNKKKEPEDRKPNDIEAVAEAYHRAYQNLESTVRNFLMNDEGLDQGRLLTFLKSRADEIGRTLLREVNEDVVPENPYQKAWDYFALTAHPYMQPNHGDMSIVRRIFEDAQEILKESKEGK